MCALSVSILGTSAGGSEEALPGDWMLAACLLAPAFPPLSVSETRQETRLSR